MRILKKTLILKHSGHKKTCNSDSAGLNKPRWAADVRDHDSLGFAFNSQNIAKTL